MYAATPSTMMITVANTNKPVLCDFFGFAVLNFFPGLARDNFDSRPDSSSSKYTFRGQPKGRKWDTHNQPGEVQ